MTRRWWGSIGLAALAMVPLLALARAQRSSPARPPDEARIADWKFAEASSTPPTLAEWARSIVRGPVVVMGRVADEDGLGIPSARVSAAADGGATEFDESAATTAESGDDGHFRLTLRADVRLVALHAEPPEARADLDSATYRRLGAPRWGGMDAGRIVLRPQRVFSGRVVGATDGLPVTGARVSLWTWLQDPRGPLAETDTDETGRFELRSPRRARHIQVDAEGFATGYSEVSTSQRDFEILLEREVSVRGRVLGEDGRPIGGASIWTNRYFRSTGDSVKETESGADGSFVVRGHAEGRVGLGADALGYLSKVISYVASGDPESAAEARLTLVATPTFSGTVVEAGTGSPIAGASIHNWKTHTDELGRFVACHFHASRLESPQLTFTAHASGFARTSVSVLRGTESAGIRMEMRRESGFAGLVVDPAGRAVADARVTMRHVGSKPRAEVEVVTDASGRFRFEGLADGLHADLRVSADGFPRRDVAEYVTLVEGRTLETVVVMGRGRGVRGRVFADGAPAAGAWVRLRRDDGSKTFDDALAVTRDDGRFEIRGVGDGRTTLAVRSQEFRTAYVDCPLPAEGFAEVSIALERGGVLEGFVESQDYKPARDARVLADFGGGEVLETYTDRSGRFRLAGLPDRAGELSCFSRPSFERARVTIEPPFSPIELRLTGSR